MPVVFQAHGMCPNWTARRSGGRDWHTSKTSVRAVSIRFGNARVSIREPLARDSRCGRRASKTKAGRSRSRTAPSSRCSRWVRPGRGDEVVAIAEGEPARRLAKATVLRRRRALSDDLRVSGGDTQQCQCRAFGDRADGNESLLAVGVGFIDHIQEVCP